MDINASVLLEYFAPLQQWLDSQNAGQPCGWTAHTPPPTPAPTSPQFVLSEHVEIIIAGALLVLAAIIGILLCRVQVRQCIVRER